MAASNNSTADVIVVGGGVVGLALAWRLARRGASVTLVDDAPARGASHAAAGMLAPVTEAHYGEEALTALNLASAKRWPAFAAELEAATGRLVGYRSEGTLAVAFDDDDHRALLDLRSYQESLGLPGEVLRSRECRSHEPLLSPRIRGGILVGSDHQVETRAVTAALLDAAARAGARQVPARVARFDTAGARVVGVALETGETLAASTTVLAAGWSSGQIPGLTPEAYPPVRPVKGQILRLGPADHGQPALGHTVRALRHGRSVYAVPRGDGRVVVGATVEEQGWDTRVTAGAVRALLEDATEVLPALGERELLEATARLRPATPDNAPLLGPVAAAPGLVLATGHYRNGFLLAPVTADVIAEVVLTGTVPEVAAPFTAARFADRPALTLGRASPTVFVGERRQKVEVRR